MRRNNEKPPAAPSQHPLWRGICWLLLLWWKLFSFVIVGNYVPGALLALLQGGWAACWASLTTWGFFQPIERAHPPLFWVAAVVLAALALCGLTIQLDETYRDRRLRARVSEKAEKAATDAMAAQNRLDVVVAALPTPLDVAAERAKYLAGMRREFSGVSLPIDPTQTITLDAIYQPLALVRNPLTADRLTRQERRALEDERQRAADDPRRAPDREMALGERQPTHMGETPAPVATAATIADALTQSVSHRLVVLGNPGAGKTTLLRKVVEDDLVGADDPDHRLPIFVSLPDLARTGLTDQLTTYLTRVATKMGAAPDYGACLWEAVTTGQALLCLDGLDEVDARLRPEVIAMINRDAARYDGVWLIGSRFTDYKGKQFDQAQFYEWEVKPLTDEQRQALAQALLPRLQRLAHQYGAIPAQAVSVQGFLVALAANAHVRSWGQNPLLLSLAASVYVAQGHLPPTRSELYRTVVDAILKSREALLLQQHPTHDLLTMRIALGEVALRLFQDRGRTFSADDLHERLMAACLALGVRWDPGEMRESFVKCGLLEPVAMNTYGFRHQAFQEYLVARGLAYRLTESEKTYQANTLVLLRQKRTRSRWSEPLRLTMGVLAQERGSEGQQQAQQWLDELAELSKMDNDPGLLCLGLAIRSMSEIPPLLALHATSAIEVWVTALIESARYKRKSLHSRLLGLSTDISRLDESLVTLAIDLLLRAFDNPEGSVRRTAAQALGQVGAPALEPLTRKLRSWTPSIRAAAAQGLGYLGIPALEPLTHALDDPDEVVCLAAAQALGQLGTPALEPLTRALDNTDPYVRSSVAKALGQLGTPALEPLTRALNDPVWWVCVEAAQALGQLGAPALEPLTRTLDNPAEGDEDVSVHLAVAKALGQVGVSALEPLTRALSDPEVQIRVAAAAARGQLGRPALESLTHALDDPGVDLNTRQEAVLALGQVGAPALELLARALDDSTVSQEAIRALGQVGTPAVGLLARALDFADPKLYTEAAQALGQLDALALKPLIHTLGTIQASVSLAAIKVLRETGTPALEPLARALSHPAVSVRAAAAQALGQLGLPSLEPLTRALDDTDWYVCKEVTQALGQLGLPALEPLTHALSHPDWSVCAAAVQALSQLGAPALEPLTRALDNPDSYLREEVSKALGQLGTPALEPLTRALGDPDWSVRAAAAEALGQLGPNAPLEPLTHALADSNIHVRVAAATALGQVGATALEPLTRALSDPNVRVRIAAAAARGQLGVPALEPLSQALNDPHSDIRAAAIRALGQLGTPALEVLLSALGDWMPPVDNAVAQALGQVGAPAINPLIRALEDKNRKVRHAAASALGNLDPNASLEPLIRPLSDPDAEVRAAAVWALGNMGPDAPIDALTRALGDAVEYVRVAAAKALGQVGPKAPLDALTRALGDRDPHVRIAAIKALGQVGERVPVEPLLRALGDSEEGVCQAAATVLRQQTVGRLVGIVHEAAEVLLTGRVGEMIGSLVQYRIADLLGSTGQPFPAFNTTLTTLLDWHYWEVRMMAAQALGKIRRQIPERAVQRLEELRKDVESQAVCDAADDALAEILSLDENVIEDDG